MAPTPPEPTAMSATCGTQGSAATSPQKAPPRSRPRISSAKQTFATLIVGSEKTEFVVHEALLTHYSKFFRAALQGGFQEAETKTVTLEDVSPSTFEIFVHWLYHDRFPSADRSDDEQLVALYENPYKQSKNNVSNLHRSKSHTLVKLYVFGDIYQAPLFRKAVLIILFNHLHVNVWRFPLYTTCNLAFQKLSANDPLCRLLVDFTCCKQKNLFIGEANGINANFLFHLANRWIRLLHGFPKIDIHNYNLAFDDYLVKDEE